MLLFKNSHFYLCGCVGWWDIQKVFGTISSRKHKNNKQLNNMKTGKAVRVNLPNSKYHDKRGIVISCNAHESVVDFKDGTVKKIRNRPLVEVAPYTDMSIQNKVAIGIKQKIEAKLKECENVNTSESIVLAKFCRELLNGNA